MILDENHAYGHGPLSELADAPVISGAVRWATVPPPGTERSSTVPPINNSRSRTLITQESNVYLLRKGGRKTIRIPFDAKTLTKLRTALARGERIIATVYGAILDPSGNVEAQTPGKRLHIQN